VIQRLLRPGFLPSCHTKPKFHCISGNRGSNEEMGSYLLDMTNMSNRIETGTQELLEFIR
jgi:hypothetical protein